MGESKTKTAIAFGRVLAGAAMALALVSAIVFFANGKNRGALAYGVVDLICCLAISSYALYLAIKGGGSPKAIAGISITYHIFLLVIGFLALLVALSLGALPLSMSGSNSASVSSIAAGSSAGASDMSGGNIGSYFVAFESFGLIYAVFGVVKIVFAFLYMKDHRRYQVVYPVMGAIADLILLAAVFSLTMEFACLSEVGRLISGLIATTGITGGAFLCLSLAQDIALWTGPEMNVSLESGVTDKRR
ncbi:MAG: hypothetical protein LKG11_03625 [Bacilli bacterium]|jgi:hypothetical protein|nr:hypothetical protein [Bacilli bacterium]